MKQVVLIHDAAIDEYISFVLLAAMPDVELLGSVIVNADCVGGPAMQTGWQLQSHLGLGKYPLSLSGARGQNPFPWPYRGDCIAMGEIAALRSAGPNPDWPPFPDGDAWLADLFGGLTEPVTVVCLCPLTPLATLLEGLPKANEMIEELIWMGGAIDVAGNLDPTTLPTGVANPYAEWNVFWDPVGTQAVLDGSTFPITLFPLDITDQAKVAPAFLAQLLTDGKTHPASDVARQAYALVSGEPFYSLWDVTATVYLAKPELYAAPVSMTIRVDTSEDRTGAILPDPNGRAVSAVLDFADLGGFYTYVAETLASVTGA